MGSFWRDLRFAFRVLTSTPGIAALAVVSLAVGIAAYTTIFSVIYTLLLAPPVYNDFDRLVVLWESNKSKDTPKAAVAPATFNDWREHSRAFERLELVAPGSSTATIGTDLASEKSQTANPVLLTYSFWQHRFGGDRQVVGQSMVVNGMTRTVTGILPQGFHLFNTDTDLWFPIEFPDLRSHDRMFRVWLIAVGKLKPSVKLTAAQAEMDVLSRQIARAHPDTNEGWGVKIDPLQEAQFGEWKPILYPLFGAVVFVLLISCANTANLLLGRFASRTHEMAVRASLGASRSRLIFQLLNEGILIALLGCGLGILLTGWGIRLFVALAPEYFPLRHEIGINLAVLLFCVAVSLLGGAVLAVIPAFAGTRSGLNAVLKRAARTSAGRGHGTFRNMFAITQIALALVLLMGAGLMIRSFLRLLSIHPGFGTSNLSTMQTFLSGPQYLLWTPNGVHIYSQTEIFYTRLLERASTLPGVQSVGLVSWLPMAYNTGRRERTFQIVGGAQTDVSHRPAADFNAVSSDYFGTLQIPMLQGRYFTRRDNQNAVWVAICQPSLRATLLAGHESVGKRILTDAGPGEKPREIIGIVADVRQDAIEKQPDPEIFAPFLQQPPITAGHGYQNRLHMNLVMRVLGDPSSTVAAVRRIAAEMDSNQPIYGVRTMSTVLSDNTSLRRLHSTLLEIFAGIALFLSAIGIYRVISHP